MPSNEPLDPEGGEARSYFGLIMTGAIVATLVVWTYIFFGAEGVNWWGKIAASVFVVAFIAFAWNWRREREKKQLDILQQWADKDSGPPKASRRRP
jgi:hypothetical protein